MGLRAFFAKGLSKVKKNLADLIATGLFAASSVLMAASNPAVTIAITACSIATSIYFDCTHTRDKRELFDELKKQISLSKEMSNLSRAIEMVRHGGTLISLLCLIGYIALSSSGVNVAFGILETITGLAVLSCHVGRKIYDSQLGSSVHKMQEEINRMLEILGTKSPDEAEQFLRKVTDATKIEELYKRLFGGLKSLLQDIGAGEVKNITEAQRILGKLIEDSGWTAESLDSSARTLAGLRSDEVDSAQVVADREPGGDARIEAAPAPTFVPPPANA